MDIDLSDSELEIDINIPLPEQQACEFCKDTKYPPKLHNEGEITVIQFVHNKVMKKFSVHENCLTYTSRKSVSESDEEAIKRTLIGSYKSVKCSHCKQAKATVGCVITNCKKVFHLPCAKKAGGELGPQGRFYCKAHISEGIDGMVHFVPTVDLLAKEQTIRWPPNRSVTYNPINDWSTISDRDQNYIKENHKNWETILVSEFFKTDLIPRVRIREIYAGHWAWCGSIEEENKDNQQPQFELVTQERIDKGEFICEYTGAVKYLAHVSGSLGRYMTEIYRPLDVHLSGAIVVDAEHQGNEARFINSVTPDTGGHIQRNATMITAWCRGAIRVLVFATKDIPKNQPVIVDYDEHGNLYFEKGLTPLNSPVKGANRSNMIVIDEDD